ncbi:hypothetical protein Pcinc_009648 [Petrolisthes cinctipes]|uniref:Uncharacterized protein n=1 Tax=Petrolisthes cinctipes TaxID=88211 RepID=A0AAE1G6K4_PETCI|nr:hypothetical protein Pcinc_009648 [Petrolisthes cinctipes]
MLLVHSNNRPPSLNVNNQQPPCTTSRESQLEGGPCTWLITTYKQSQGTSINKPPTNPPQFPTPRRWNVLGEGIWLANPWQASKQASSWGGSEEERGKMYMSSIREGGEDNGWR